MPPMIAMTMNQITVIGPNKVETRAVPCDCTANSADQDDTVSGRTYGSNAGVATSVLRPPTSTDSAGVMNEEP